MTWQSHSKDVRDFCQSWLLAHYCLPFNLHIVSKRHSSQTHSAAMAGMDLLPAVHHAQYPPSVQSQFTASRCQSIRSRPQIILSQKAMRRTAFGKPMQRHARSVIVCSASSQTISAGSAKPLRFIQHKEEAFWFYRFLSIVYDHIGK